MTDAPTPSEPEPTDGLRYAEAIDELEAILAELEDDTLDVDLLSARVARAATLIQLCRTRIRDTRIEVERIVADLEAPS